MTDDAYRPEANPAADGRCHEVPEDGRCHEAPEDGRCREGRDVGRCHEGRDVGRCHEGRDVGRCHEERHGGCNHDGRADRGCNRGERRDRGETTNEDAPEAGVPKVRAPRDCDDPEGGSDPLDENRSAGTPLDQCSRALELVALARAVAETLLALARLIRHL